MHRFFDLVTRKAIIILAFILAITAFFGSQLTKLHIDTSVMRMLVEDLPAKRQYDRYRKELLERGTDDRLQPDKAIEYGLMYFAKLLKDTRGDISLALASYNAGPNRVREFEGIPPYVETVGFRNRILQYYRDYLSKARDE